ncbi:hypothetical protein T07_2702 [Trichinella nelsoni]|uniref:F-box domain-containing protein n=1 Tax=Trichinella nelsoni TaxID=6336 RepID=A0A0V0SGQ4_9BILA|nr:hypothetical protein T07_2702 [Trichinella nelsoni]
MTGCSIWPACCQHSALDPSRYVAARSLNDRFHLYPQRAYYLLVSVIACVLKARHIHYSHENNRSPRYKMLQTEEMQHLELDDAYRCNWGIWFNIFRLMRTEDIMRLAYASREINAMAQSYFNYKMLQTEEMQHLELDDAYRCNWGIWFNIFRLMRTEDIMRLAYASREINAMAQSYFKYEHFGTIRSEWASFCLIIYYYLINNNMT